MEPKENSVNKNKIAGSLFWVFGERIAAQLVSMLVTIILARVLDPEHYGIISIVTVFITFLNVFVSYGFGSALVQKKDADEEDFNTALIFSSVLAWVLYLLLFAASPWIADFYEMPMLDPVLRVMGLRLPLAAVNSVQHARVQRSMRFKRFFWSTFLGTVISGIVGIAMAYLGCGVWALVGQYLTNTTVGTIILFMIDSWLPKLQFSFQKAKQIWSFGWKVLTTQLVATLGNDIQNLVVGKVFGSADLAYYDQGKKYPALLVTNLSSAIDKVMLSAYSKEQDDRQRLLGMLRRSVRTGVYVLAPICLGFAMVAEPFVQVVLTKKWLASVPFIQVFCLAYMTRPMESSCRQALLSIGKGSMVLGCILAVNVVSLGCIAVAVFVFESVFMIALSSLLGTVVSLVTFLWCANRFLGYSPKMQMQDVLPTLIAGCVMCVAVYLTAMLPLGTMISLVLQILVGAASYVGASWIMKVEAFRYLWNMIMEPLKRRGNSGKK